MADCFALIEKEMFAGPWVLGDAYSVADPYLFTIAGWLASDSVDIAAYPKVADHFRRMAELEPVRRVLAREAAAA
jgi:glutathione S-transferase